jgi:hypothetical protein
MRIHQILGKIFSQQKPLRGVWIRWSIEISYARGTLCFSTKINDAMGRQNIERQFCQTVQLNGLVLR